MHEKRNFVLVIFFIGALAWAIWSWFLAGADTWSYVATALAVLLGGWLLHALVYEDRLPDRLCEIVGATYFDADGICLFPLIREGSTGPELSIYYQNRFENPASVVVHLRPPDRSFVVMPGASDIHIAFTVGGGDVGVIHQPVTVPDDIRGEIVNVQMVAVSHFPRAHGQRLRRRPREARGCGSMQVDWAGNAMRVGVHEVDGSISLADPVTLHLPMPSVPGSEGERDRTWRQELL